ncbi:MAG: hypothetical protein P9L99_08030 [Candidatus Lernaella stagnicola]|nr:hypothetical protein [Candidatus Lernaella stagnicola]
MAEKFRQELIGIVDGLAILDEDQAVNYNLGQLLRLSRGITAGYWREDEFPELFSRLRDILIRARSFYTGHRWFMRDLRNLRQDLPRGHWWLWIEEL